MQSIVWNFKMSDISENLYLTFSRTTEFNYGRKLPERQYWNSICVRTETQLWGTQATWPPWTRAQAPQVGDMFPRWEQLSVKQSRLPFCFLPPSFISSKTYVGGCEDPWSSAKCILSKAQHRAMAETREDQTKPRMLLSEDRGFKTPSTFLIILVYLVLISVRKSSYDLPVLCLDHYITLLSFFANLDNSLNLVVFASASSLRNVLLR